MWEIKYYDTPDGRCPTEEFLEALRTSNKMQELSMIERKLRLLEEYGPMLRRPHVEYLNNKIYELRIPVKSQQYRLLYFYFYQDKIIISHGIKKEDKVPSAEIKKAMRYRADYLSRYERKK